MCCVQEKDDANSFGFANLRVMDYNQIAKVRLYTMDYFKEAKVSFIDSIRQDLLG
jgi:hypothetical protein